MPTTLWIKLFAIALVAWVGFGTTAVGVVAVLVVVGLLVLLALLDAGQCERLGEEETGRRSEDRTVTDADIGALVRRLFSVAVGPFYLVLVVLGCLGVGGRGDLERGRWGDPQTQKAQAEATMCGGHGCGSAGGCGTGGCGASSGGACGCGGGSKK